MTDSVDSRPKTLPLFELEEYSGPSPTSATVREIDAEIINERIFFFFSRGTFYVDLSNYPGGLDGLLKDVRDGEFHYEDDTTNWPDPPQSPLSLKNEYLTYVVYKLSAKNWQFAHDYPPFTIGEKGKDSKCYFEARRYDKYGNKEKVSSEHRVPVSEDCSVAYFIADGWKAKGFVGQYIHALNIHVELIYDGLGRARIPLIIDPDVRYPGGSG